MTLTYRGQKYNQNNAAASNPQRPSLVYRGQKVAADNSRTTLFKPRRGGAFLWLIRLQGLAALPSNVQTKLRRRGTHPRQSQHQSAPHQLPPASNRPNLISIIGQDLSKSEIHRYPEVIEGVRNPCS